MAAQNQAATQSSDPTPAPCRGGGVGRGDTFSQLVKEGWHGGDTYTHKEGLYAGDTSVAARRLNAAAPVSLDRQSVLTYIYEHRRQGEQSLLHSPSFARGSQPSQNIDTETRAVSVLC